ncbi:MAG: DUF1569 domain-containing protein [Leptospiraceae bacterium]|nr:DUF1569 domain-containing protein [Leptospiraceae bacterium]
MKVIRLDSLESALVELKKLSLAKELKSNGKWEANRVFLHCAQSIDYSISGYPKNKPILIQKTIGRLVLNKFLSQGYMSHNLSDPIPGAPILESQKDFHPALDTLISSIDRFLQWDKKLSPHFVYGEVEKGDYNRIHAMHIADHLSEIDILS